MKILNQPCILSNGSYLVTVDYETESLGFGKDIKDTILTLQELYSNYIENRILIDPQFKEETGKCYCGHTQFCDCGDLTLDMFKEHLENGNIYFNKNNGYQKVEF